MRIRTIAVGLGGVAIGVLVGLAPRVKPAASEPAAGAAEQVQEAAGDTGSVAPIAELRAAGSAGVAQAAAELPPGEHTAGLAELQQNAAKQEKLRIYWDRLAANPKDPELLNLVLALQQDEPQNQLNTLALVLPANADNVQLQHRYAQLLASIGQLDQAAQIYETMQRDYPSESRLAGMELARLAKQRNDPQQARALLLAASQDIEAGVRKNLYLARQFLEMEMATDAVTFAQLAMDDAEGRAMQMAAAAELGEALLRSGKPAEARAVLLPVAEQDAWRGLKSRAEALLAELP